MAGLHTSLHAANPENITAGEIALLPEYCRHTQMFTEDDPRSSLPTPARKWYERLGKSYLGLHHYCFGLIDVMRANRADTTPFRRRALYTYAVDEYRYVIKNSTPDFPLLPEIYLRIGEAQVELQDYGGALDAFAASRAIKPDYWPPYVRWADVLFKLGKRNDALDHLEEGLVLMPAERALQEAYKRMGGTPERLQRAAARLAPRAAPEAAVAAAAQASAPAEAASSSAMPK